MEKSPEKINIGESQEQEIIEDKSDQLIAENYEKEAQRLGIKYMGMVGTPGLDMEPFAYFRCPKTKGTFTVGKSEVVEEILIAHRRKFGIEDEK